MYPQPPRKDCYGPNTIICTFKVFSNHLLCDADSKQSAVFLTFVSTWSWPPSVSSLTHIQLKLDHSPVWMPSIHCVCVCVCVCVCHCCHWGLIKVQSESTEKLEHANTYRASTGDERCQARSASLPLFHSQWREKGSSVTVTCSFCSGAVSGQSLGVAWWKYSAITSLVW